MKQSMKLVVLLCLGIVCGGTFNAPRARAGEPPPSSLTSPVPSSLSWAKVAPTEMGAILEFLTVQTKGNYERIHTFQATYEINNENYLSALTVKKLFGEKLPKGDVPALIEHWEATLKVAIDMNSGNIFRQNDSTRFVLLTTNSREPFVIPQYHLTDNYSIVTSEDYKYFLPKEEPADNVVTANQPEGHNKRHARRAPAEQAHKKDHGDLIDPRNFYRCSSAQKSWEETQLYQSTLKGEHGAEQQKLAERLEVDKADQGGDMWYRLRLPIPGPNGVKTTFTSVWSSLAGFNPVSKTLTVADKAGEATEGSTTWKWKNIDGVYVPEAVQYVTHPKGTPANVDALNQTITLKECVLNASLAPNQFDYSALGMKAGDLVFDDIDQTVFIIDGGGKPTRLCAYYEKYIPPPPGVPNWNYRLVIGGGAAIIAIALAGLILFRRRRKASPKPAP
jgi:hypothetical protein